MSWKYWLAGAPSHPESISSLLFGEFLSNNRRPSGIESQGECASWGGLGTKESDRRDMKEGKYKEPSPCLLQWGKRGIVSRLKPPGWNWVLVDKFCLLWQPRLLDWWTYSWRQIQSEHAHLSFVICWIEWDTRIQSILSLWQVRILWPQEYWPWVEQTWKSGGGGLKECACSHRFAWWVVRVAHGKAAELLHWEALHFNEIKKTSRVGGSTLHNGFAVFWTAGAAAGKQHSWWPALLDGGIQGDAPSTPSWMCRMKSGAGSKIGADLCTYNEVEKIAFARIPLKESPEYIWMKKYISKPLGWRVRPKSIFKLEKLLLNFSARDKERNLS